MHETHVACARCAGLTAIVALEDVTSENGRRLSPPTVSDSAETPVPTKRGDVPLRSHGHDAPDSHENHRGRRWNVVAALDGAVIGPAATSLPCILVKLQHAHHSRDPLQNPASVARPALRAGDVLMYSSAVLHRGEPNTTNARRPVLVFRSRSTRLHS